MLGVALARALVVLALAATALAADFYAALGVSRQAGDRELKKAYRVRMRSSQGEGKLSKQYHPDKNDSDEAKARFLEVSRAYEVLSDPEKRKTYDRFGEEGLKQQEGGGRSGDPFDVFRQAFGFGGGGGGQQQQRRGQNMLAEIEVDLKAMYEGDSMKFSVARKAICEQCDGTGAKSEKDIITCPVCEGRGVRVVRHQLGPGIFQQMQMHCDRCGGRGKSIKHVCPSCKGARIVDSHSDLNLHIDRGMPEGAEVVFEGEADESPEVVAGDVIVRVRSKKQKGAFVRKESNLYWKEPISVAEALLGFKHTVKGLDGHDIVLSRTGVTQSGFVDVITGEGMPIYHLSGHGDLFVEYQVILPPKLSTKQREALEQAFGYRHPDAKEGGHTEL
ncbi:DnaJ-related protein scj1 [Rhodotorula toruloides]|uniref:Chaperone regulator n=1 Tax=Rhodotorula toruloides (strain NP11) TaxID=1130832 RepID=M7X591_RHOT1|nr:chaperone regulator [Rhodotorula toruloides NP11]EMS25240.1 chaperone regulator [Rhodotorula toruloides NP11]